MSHAILAVGTAVLALLSAMGGQSEPHPPTTTIAAEGSTERPRRIVVRNATLYPHHLARTGQMSSTAASEEPLRCMSIVIDGGTIVAIVPTIPEDLAPGDVLVDCHGRFVVPGLIEVTGIARPTYADAARRTIDGVTTLVGPWSQTEIEWYGQLSEAASFVIPDLTVGLSDQTTQTQPEVIPASEAASTRSERAFLLHEWTAGRAVRLGLVDRGALGVSLRGDLLVVNEDPLENLATVRQPWQMVVGGEALRISQLETARAMQTKALDSLEAMPAPPFAARTYSIETAGLRVARLDLSRGGDRGLERWSPPIDQATAWTMRAVGDAVDRPWTSTIQYVRGPLAGVSVDIESNATSIKATVREPAPEGDAGVRPEPSISTIEGRADALALDPASIVRWFGTRLARLESGESLPLRVLELVPRGGRLVLGIRDVTLERVSPDACPLGAMADDLAFRVVGRDNETMGWLRARSAAEPDAGRLELVHAALFAADGITEYRLSQSKDVPLGNEPLNTPTSPLPASGSTQGRHQ